jgi:hypothetical protein
MINERLITGEELSNKKDTLNKIRVDNINWVIYYLDETTGEKWLEEYPFAEMQGGGPPQLRQIERYPWE